MGAGGGGFDPISGLTNLIGGIAGGASPFGPPGGPAGFLSDGSGGGSFPSNLFSSYFGPTASSFDYSNIAPEAATEQATNLGQQDTSQQDGGGSSVSPPESFPQQQMTQTQAQPLTQQNEQQWWGGPTGLGGPTAGPPSITSPAQAATRTGGATGQWNPAPGTGNPPAIGAADAAQQAASLGIPPESVVNPATGTNVIPDVAQRAADPPAVNNQFPGINAPTAPGGTVSGAPDPFSAAARPGQVGQPTDPFATTATGGTPPGFNPEAGANYFQPGPSDYRFPTVAGGVRGDGQYGGPSYPGGGAGDVSGTAATNPAAANIQASFNQMPPEAQQFVRGLLSLLPPGIRQMLAPFLGGMQGGGQQQQGGGQGLQRPTPEQYTQLYNQRRAAGYPMAGIQTPQQYAQQYGQSDQPIPESISGHEGDDLRTGPPYELPADRPRPSDITGPGDTAATRGVAHPLPPDRPVPSEITGPTDTAATRGVAAAPSAAEQTAALTPVEAQDSSAPSVTAPAPSPSAPSTPTPVETVDIPGRAGARRRLAARPQVATASMGPTGAPGEPGAVSDNATRFIARKEGFKRHAYWDHRQWSIGYGTRASGPGETITPQEAERRLHQETRKAAAAVDRIVPPNTPQHVKDALTSFTYNVGSGWTRNSNLARAVRAGNWREAARIMQQYNRASGRVNSTLVQRRREEANMLLGAA